MKAHSMHIRKPGERDGEKISFWAVSHKSGTVCPLGNQVRGMVKISFYNTRILKRATVCTSWSSVREMVKNLFSDKYCKGNQVREMVKKSFSEWYLAKCQSEHIRKSGKRPWKNHILVGTKKAAVCTSGNQVREIVKKIIFWEIT